MNPTEDLHVAIDWNRAFTFFLNQQCDSDVKGRDLIHIEAGSKSWIDTYTGAVLITRAGLFTFASLGNQTATAHDTTRYVLRTLKKLTEANRLSQSIITEHGFFKNTSRDPRKRNNAEQKLGF